MEGQNPIFNGVGDAQQNDVGLPRFPPGFRFNPRDDELVIHYLRNKIAGKPLLYNVFNDISILQYHPEKLHEQFKAYGEKKWYFFTARDRKYDFGLRPERTTPYGFWKATGREKMIKFNKAIVGRRRGLVFYNAADQEKTNWVMREYLIYDGSKESPPPPPLPPRKSTKRKGPKPPKQLNKWVLCTIHKKKGQKPKEEDTKANEAIVPGPSSSQPDIKKKKKVMTKKQPKEPKVKMRKNCGQKKATEGQDVCGVTPIAAMSASETFNHSQPAQTFPQSYDHQSQGNFMSMNNFDRLHEFQNILETSLRDFSRPSYHDLQLPVNSVSDIDNLIPISGSMMSTHSVDQLCTLHEALEDRREAAWYPTPIIGDMSMQTLSEQRTMREITNAEQSSGLHPYIAGSGVTTYTAYNYPQSGQSFGLDNNNQSGGNTMITQNYDQQGILQKNSGEDLRIDTQQHDSNLLSKSTTFVHNDFNYGWLPNSENGTNNTYFNSSTYGFSQLLDEGDIFFKNGGDPFIPPFDQHLLDEHLFSQLEIDVIQEMYIHNDQKQSHITTLQNGAAPQGNTICQKS
ncbi:uncharacterized protein [Typha angustifolia]|uniref:uncharacterized protein n=1 Tax=Typha angustifolia TaxID=59011 RepID=UPI003C2DBFA9